MSLEAKIDLERLAKAVAVKDREKAALVIGNAVMDAAETACHMFRDSLELDVTSFVVERVGTCTAELVRKTRKTKGGR